MNKLSKLHYKILNPQFNSVGVLELKANKKPTMFPVVSHFTGLYCKEKKNIQQLLLWTFHIPTYKWITKTIQGSTLLFFLNTCVWDFQIHQFLKVVSFISGSEFIGQLLKKVF